MLDGIHLRSVELDVQCLHHIPCDSAGEEAPMNFQHLDHRNVVKDTVDRHSESGNQQTHGKHGNHAAVV